MIPRSHSALAWRLAAIGVALGVVLAAQIGRNGCLRHGASAVAVVATSIEATPVDHGAEGGHAGCPLCTAAPIGPSAAAPVEIAAPAVATAVATVDTPCVDAALAADPPLDYAPKTSPPVV